MTPDELIAAIEERVRDHRRRSDAGSFFDRVLPGPAADDELAAAEAALGFPLPPLLRRLYAEVANGGFGPGYGLLGVGSGTTDDLGRDLVAAYRAMREGPPDDRVGGSAPPAPDPYWSWPEGLLPAVYLGCAMYACFDCASEGAPVAWFEPNPHVRGAPWDDAFFSLAPSLFAYFDAWQRDVDLLEQAAQRAFPTEGEPH